jgi:NAD(P)-dependent dehydrogenase (short-subunit alcohol dehydrogenase family)
MSEFKDNVYIITGATSGMGKGIAEKLAAKGALLVINGRDEIKGLKTLDELPTSGKISHQWVQGDVGQAGVNEKLVKVAIEQFGRLDGIICNAGGLGLGSVTEVSMEIWNETLNTNLNGVFYLSRYAIPEMLKRGGGNILVNASIAAFKFFPNHPAYCSAKAGVVALTKQMAAEYGPQIRANAICPGPVDTPLIWESAKAFPDPSSAVQSAGQSTAMKRLGLPQDIAELACFLLSDKASWITGTAVTIDGGAIFR